MAESLAFDFSAPLADVHQVSPTGTRLPPVNSSTLRTKHCGTMGALAVQPRVAAQQQTLLEAYQQHGDLTDKEMETVTGIERSTVIPRRHELMATGLVEEVSTRKNPDSGVSNTTFRACAQRPTR